MKNTVEILIGVLVAGTFGVVGMVHIANASKSQSPVAIVAQAHVNSPKELSDGDGEINDDAKYDDVKEKQEMNRLQSLSNITPQQAQTVALSKVSGKVHQVELNNEDGNLIYTVKIDKSEVKVDAGNGKVLYVEQAGRENPQSDRIRSSIQVPQSMKQPDAQND